MASESAAEQLGGAAAPSTAGAPTEGPPRQPAVGAAATDDSLPRVFGRYLLLKRLSRGGMGEIFLAKLGEIQGFEKLVIIKKILPNLGADQEFIKRFIDEAQVAIKLNHANIAPVFEVGKVDGEYFLAIEYVEGRDLRRIMSRQREVQTRLPPDLCLFIGRELANGLAYAHRRTDEHGRSLALVHCDISPPNVMVSFEGEVKVIDFGIAKSAIRISGTNPNMGFGKFGYMAPEQLLRGGVVDRRTDLYAAGVVLYELLTGGRLFQFPEGADYKQIARMVTQGKITPPSVRDPRLDPELDAIVMRALATKQADRHQSAEELRDSLQAKLSQLNPTISADALAHYLRELFADELIDERRLVASMKAVDVAPFKEELTQATTQHTVTFARAQEVPAAVTAPAEGPPATSTGAPAPSRALFLGAAGAAVIAGGALAFLVVRSLEPRGSVVVAAPPIAPAPPPPAPPSAATASVAAPPGPGPEPAGLTPAAEPADPPPSPPAHPVGRRDKRHPHEQAAPGTATHRSPQTVQAKFRSLRQEYLAFKAQYGAVLEDRWNAIATEITFGKADKYEQVDAMLDDLRRAMEKVRSGG